MKSEAMERDEFFSTIDRISSFAIVNLLWVAVSVFIITLPAATAGLFAVCSDWAQGKQHETFARFFGAMRHHAGQATVLALVDGLLLGLVSVNLIIVPGMGLPNLFLWLFIALLLFVGVLVLCANLYLWPLLVSYDAPLLKLARIAIILVFRHVGWSWSLLAACVLVLLGSAFLLPKGLIVLIPFSACALIISKGAWHIIRQYDADLQSLQVGTAS